MISLHSFISKISEEYEIIIDRENIQKKKYAKDGIYLDRISFEHINLDDILRTELVPLILPMLFYFSHKEVEVCRKKIYKVYLATLCEIAKNGFVQGGILKTIDTYIGEHFNRNQHYHLLKAALTQENIKILYDRSHHYEETIIFESGIPRKMHIKAFDLFYLYWKWMKGIEKKERRQVLENFINEAPIYQQYIYDQTDFNKMKSLREEMGMFKEKVLKTCFQLEEVFCSLDKYDGHVSKENINEICSEISEQVGFNIQTVVRIKDIEAVFIAYAQRVGFLKFQKIIENLSPYDEILLPDGRRTCNRIYGFNNFCCGIHEVKKVKYEVSYPIGLNIDELFRLQREEIINQGENLIYISEGYFEVEIDGVQVKTRELIAVNAKLYIFVGKIKATSIAYIDGKQIRGEQGLKLIAKIRKQWNYECRQNQLFIYIKDIVYSNESDKMKNMTVQVGENRFTRTINQNGFARLSEKYVPINDENSRVLLEVFINREKIREEIFELEKLMVFGFQSGLRIYDKIDLSQWYGDNRLVVFSRNQLTANKNLQFLSENQGYYVYMATADFSAGKVDVGSLCIEIKNVNHPYFSFASGYQWNNEKICFEKDDDVIFSVNNLLDCQYKFYLNFYHDNSKHTICLEQVKNLNNINLWKIICDENRKVGNWTISLYREQQKTAEISFVVLPKLQLRQLDNIVSEGEKVAVEVTACTECFESSNSLVKSYCLVAGNCEIEMLGRFVKVKPIEIEIYNDLSDVFQKIKLMPNVWGIRILENNKNEWQKMKEMGLFYRKLNRYTVFICNTISFILEIDAGEGIVRREMRPGFTILEIKRLIKKWHAVNNITLKEINGSAQKNIRIIYEPNLLPAGIMREGNKMSASFRYDGPIGVMVGIVAFCDGVKISKMGEEMLFQHYTLSVEIEGLDKIVSKEVIFEGRFDNQDAFIIFKEKISPLPQTESVISDSNNIASLFSLLKIAENAISKKEVFMGSNPTVLSLLGAGGMK